MVARVGPDRLLTFYADELGQLPDEADRAGKYIVFKSHHGSHDLDAWLAERDAPLVLSLRDPRDCCLSMSQRFSAPLRHSVQWIANDCQRLTRLAERGYPLMRFEERFFEMRSSVDWLSDCLGITCAPEVKDDVFARYQTEAVRSFAAKLETLPPERLTLVANHQMDRGHANPGAPHRGWAHGKVARSPHARAGGANPIVPPFPGPVRLRRLTAERLRASRQVFNLKRKSSVASRRGREPGTVAPLDQTMGEHAIRVPNRPRPGVGFAPARHLRDDRTPVKKQHLVALLGASLLDLVIGGPFRAGSIAIRRYTRTIPCGLRGN